MQLSITKTFDKMKTYKLNLSEYQLTLIANALLLARVNDKDNAVALNKDRSALELAIREINVEDNWRDRNNITTGLQG